MMLSQTMVGKGGIFEHPAPFEVETGPCRGGTHTWNFPEVITMLKWPSLHLHIIDQGKYGQICRKPTGFMIRNHRHAARLFKDWLLPQQLWKLGGVEMGWDPEAKCFATAPLKEYPSQLCAALASIILSDVNSAPKALGNPVDLVDFERFDLRTSHLCQVLDNREGGDMRPDWHQG